MGAHDEMLPMKKSTILEIEVQKDPHDAAGKPDGGELRPQPSRVYQIVVISATFCAMVFLAHYSIQGNVASAMFKAPVTVSLTPPPTTVLDEVNRNAAVAVATAAAAAAEEEAPRWNPCEGRYIYMYEMPRRFNYDLVRDCGKLRPWMDMCPFVANGGMGQPLGDEGGVFSDRGWYATDQFMLDIIFHGRMERYECLTGDPSLAAAVFVPFYGSLDSGRYLFGFNTSIRDALSLDLAGWLAQRPEWRTMGGRDHFFVAGRTTTDLQRRADELWGTKLLKFPEIDNMTAFVLERSSPSERHFPIPYPTYFHPEAAADVLAWQEKVRKAERRWLFSFAGAPRPGSNKTVRGEIIQQCGASSLCNLFHCRFTHGHGGPANCNSPGGVMRVFQSSDFCLQPRGDTLTRRSTFDAILAGCIPVFFDPDSAHTQYTQHLPRDHRRYSVLIPHAAVSAGNVSIEETLRKFRPEEVTSMREEVIGLIPKVVYADPRSTRVDFKDAFDFTVEAAINRVAARRRGGAASPTASRTKT